MKLSLSSLFSIRVDRYTLLSLLTQQMSSLAMIGLNLLTTSCVCFVQHWSKLDYDKGDPWPVWRFDHAAVCLGFGGDHPQLLVTGGVDASLKYLNDAWTLDIKSLRWREVRIVSADCCGVGSMWPSLTQSDFWLIFA